MPTPVEHNPRKPKGYRTWYEMYLGVVAIHDGVATRFAVSDDENKGDVTTFDIDYIKARAMDEIAPKLPSQGNKDLMFYYIRNLEHPAHVDILDIVRNIPVKP